MDSLLERSKVESRYAEPTKHKAQEFVEKFPQCVSAADPESAGDRDGRVGAADAVFD